MDNITGCSCGVEAGEHKRPGPGTNDKASAYSRAGKQSRQAADNSALASIGNIDWPVDL